MLNLFVNKPYICAHTYMVVQNNIDVISHIVETIFTAVDMSNDVKIVCY